MGLQIQRRKLRKGDPPFYTDPIFIIPNDELGILFSRGSHSYKLTFTARILTRMSSTFYLSARPLSDIVLNILRP